MFDDLLPTFTTPDSQGPSAFASQLLSARMEFLVSLDTDESQLRTDAVLAVTHELIPTLQNLGMRDAIASTPTFRV